MPFLSLVGGLAALSLLAPAQASTVFLDAHLANPQLARSYFGTLSGVAVWLSNMGEGRVVSRAVLEAGGQGFRLQLPGQLDVKTRPYQICDGPSMTPSQVRTYTPETLMLYHKGLNKALGPVFQADDPSNPTKTTTYVYSDVAARISGKCTFLNQRYDLTLRPGWNAVMTATRPTRDGNTLFITRASENLPFWIGGSLKFDHVDQVLPSSFFRKL